MEKEEKDLRIYRNDVYHCAKCHMCKYIDFNDIANERFTEICPSGSQLLFEAYFSSGKMELARALMNQEIKPSPKLLEIFYKCTLCGGCTEVCSIQKELRPSDVFHTVRSWIIKNKVGPLPGHKELIDNTLSNDNPWGHDPKERGKWAEDLDIPPISDETEVIFFVGGVLSYDSNGQKIAKNIVEIFKKIDLKFGLLGEEEACCGSPVLIVGDHQSFDKIYEKNIETFLKYNKPIVTACSGCYNMLQNVYNLKSHKIQVTHIAEYLFKLMRKKRLIFSKEINKTVTYHDPCHLGRHSKIYDPPRKLLAKIPGVKFVEMDRIREFSFCCGAGGGVKKVYPDYALDVAKERIEEALSKNADILVSTCPFCERNFRDAGGIEVKDIIELVLEAL
jgi:Fe-S oxidoreductase